MDIQLKHLATDYPTLLPAIQRAIYDTYSQTQKVIAALRADELVKSRQGFLSWSLNETIICNNIAELGFREIHLCRTANCNNSALHLEIHTPHAVIVFSKVSKGGQVPRKAKYRQEYIDQCCMWEWKTDVKPFTENCRPLYVITYALPKDADSMPEIYIGRLNSSQDAWSCNHPISAVLSETTIAKQNEERAKVALSEDITKVTNIRFKNA